MTEALIERGIMGIVILGLATACILLWRAKETLHERLEAQQERRVVDAKEVTSLVIEQQREMLEVATRLESSVKTLITVQRGGAE